MGNFSFSMIWGNVRCQHSFWRSGSAVRSRTAGDRLPTHTHTSRSSTSWATHFYLIKTTWACLAGLWAGAPVAFLLFSPTISSSRSAPRRTLEPCITIKHYHGDANQDWNNDNYNFKSRAARKDFGMIESFRTPNEWKWWELYSQLLSPRLNMNSEPQEHVYLVFSECL